jgi:hypothetical protein
MIVGVSLSSSPDLPSLGFGPEHMWAAAIEVPRHLLIAGHKIAYGGDLRSGSFTMDLLRLTSAHVRAVPEHAATDPGPPVRSYLAWPLYEHASANELADVAEAAELERVAPPPEAVSDGETPFTRARGLNEMRRRMNEEIGARLVLGGKTSGYSGVLPGIAEEVLLALEADKPLYLCGAFGGCARLLVQALGGDAYPRAFTEEGAEDGLSPEAVQTRRALLASYRDRAPSEPGFDRLKRVLQNYGPARLCANNGLSSKENDLLFRSPDHQLLIALVLRGLVAKSAA